MVLAARFWQRMGKTWDGYKPPDGLMGHHQLQILQILEIPLISREREKERKTDRQTDRKKDREKERERESSVLWMVRLVDTHPWNTTGTGGGTGRPESGKSVRSFSHPKVTTWPRRGFGEQNEAPIGTPNTEEYGFTP